MDLYLWANALLHALNSFEFTVSTLYSVSQLFRKGGGSIKDSEEVSRAVCSSRFFFLVTSFSNFASTPVLW